MSKALSSIKGHFTFFFTLFFPVALCLYFNEVALGHIHAFLLNETLSSRDYFNFWVLGILVIVLAAANLDILLFIHGRAALRMYRCEKNMVNVNIWMCCQMILIGYFAQRFIFSLLYDISIGYAMDYCLMMIVSIINLMISTTVFYSAVEKAAWDDAEIEELLACPVAYDDKTDTLAVVHEGGQDIIAVRYLVSIPIKQLPENTICVYVRNDVDVDNVVRCMTFTFASEERVRLATRKIKSYF